MSRPQYCPDLDLALLLETAEAIASRNFCEAAAAIHPESDIRVFPLCGDASGLYYGKSNPLNAVKGAGLNGPVDQKRWDALEEFHRSAPSPVVIDLCPLADDAFIAMLSSRGYTIGSFETVTFRVLEAALTTPSTINPNPALRIAQVSRDEADAWSRVIDTGFADGGEPFNFGIDIGKVRSGLSQTVSLLATIDGIPAGGAAMSIHRGVAHLCGAAVLPAFRRRGVQQALTAARLEIAQSRGCNLAKLDVRAGTPSHRNACRAGFQVAYTRPQLVKAFA